MTESTIHPSPAQLRAFIAGTLAADDVVATARHVGACPQCASAARGAYDVEASAAAVRRDLLRREPARAGWWASIAAMVAIAALGAWLVTRPPKRRASPNRWDALTASALRSGRIEPPAILSDLRPVASQLRDAKHGTNKEIVLRPAGQVVESDRPLFSWTALPDATSYRVLLFSRGAEVARSAPLSASSWQPPIPLPRGAVCEWQVIAATPHGEVVLPGPDTPRALFGVLSVASMNEMARARRERPGDHLLLGVLYARAGIVDRAEEELRPYPALHRSIAAWR